jgi:hypothetical protein
MIAAKGNPSRKKPLQKKYFGFRVILQVILAPKQAKGS